MTFSKTLSKFSTKFFNITINIQYRKIEAIVMYVDPTEYESRQKKTKYRVAMFCDFSGSMNVAAFENNSSELKTLQAGQVGT